MKFDRRDIVRLGSALTLGSVLPGVVSATTGGARDFDAKYQKVLSQLRGELGRLGLTETEALSIVTDVPMNGGLRHDSDLDLLAPGQFVIQPCARVEDVPERNRPDVLPMFHECAVLLADDRDVDAALRQMMGILVDVFGLAPAQLGFVSVPAAEILRPTLSDMNYVFDDVVFVRDRGEAFAARDSSGFFFPDPNRPDHYTTVGIYARLSETAAPRITSYPPSSGWTEIGELVIDGGVAPILSIGTERLTLAATGAFPTWQDRLPALFEMVEAARTGLPRPEGLDAFR